MLEIHQKLSSFEQLKVQLKACRESAIKTFRTHPYIITALISAAVLAVGVSLRACLGQSGSTSLPATVPSILIASDKAVTDPNKQGFAPGPKNATSSFSKFDAAALLVQETVETAVTISTVHKVFTRNWDPEASLLKKIAELVRAGVSGGMLTRVLKAAVAKRAGLSARSLSPLDGVTIRKTPMDAGLLIIAATGILPLVKDVAKEALESIAVSYSGLHF